VYAATPSSKTSVFNSTTDAGEVQLNIINGAIRSGIDFCALLRNVIIMERTDNNKKEGRDGTHEHALPHEIGDKEREKMKLASQEAEKDIENDLETSATSPNDDLDEGETARQGDDGAGLI